jgi:large subunit ribosomal protein L25
VCLDAAEGCVQTFGSATRHQSFQIDRIVAGRFPARCMFPCRCYGRYNVRLSRRSGRGSVGFLNENRLSSTEARSFMSNKFEISAERRADVGKGASRRLRRTGRVPAVLYGGDRDPVNLTLDHNFMIHAIADEGFTSSVLDMVVEDGTRQGVVMRDLQMHPFKPLITHVDFLRVTKGQQLKIDVPIHFVNEEVSPAAKAGGVVISHQVTEVEISATPENLPEYLEVDLANLEPGDSVLLSQIKLPEGVSVPALEVSDDNDYSLVTAIYIREGQGSGELAAEADAAAAIDAEVDTVSDEEPEDEEGAEDEAAPEDEESESKDD